MTENADVQIEDQEFQLEPDNELRFEVENKNETVVLEVCIDKVNFFPLQVVLLNLHLMIIW